MKRYLFSLILILMLFTAIGQEIRVVDTQTGRPLEGVFIQSGKHSVMTGPEGTATLDHFQPADVLTFRHPSYKKIRLTRSEALKMKEGIKLEESPVSIDEVVISVSRTPQRTSEIPHRVESMDTDALQRDNAGTLADLAGKFSDVFIQKSQQGGGSPMIRGFSANRLLLVIDGIRMNNAIYRSGNLQNIVSVDALSLERMEVIPGPGSVIYGSDALGGVISFTTARPSLSTGKPWHQEARFLARHSTAFNGSTFHGRWSVGTPVWGFLMNATWSSFSDLIMGKHGPAEYLRPEFVFRMPFAGRDSIASNPNPRKQLHSGYNQLNLLSKLRYRPSPKTDINLGLHYSGTSEVPRYDRLMTYGKGRLKYGDWYYGKQPWWLWSANIRHSAQNQFFDQMNLMAGYQTYEESRHDRNLDSPLLFHRTENLSVFTLNADFSKNAGQDFFIQYGAEGAWNRISSSGVSENLLTSTRKPIAPRYPDNSVYRNYGLYLSGRDKHSEKLLLHGGLRYTHTVTYGTFSPDYGFPFSRFDNRNDALNGNLGITWLPGSFWQINLLASTGFRAPNIDDIGKVFDSEPGNVVVPNPGLKPEYARNIEAGIQKRMGNRVKTEVSLFFTHLRSAIVRRDFTINGRDSLMYNGVPSKVEALVNTDAARVWGVSVSAEWHLLPWLLVASDLTQMSGEDSDGFALRHVPPFNGSASLSLNRGRWFAMADFRFNGSIPFARMAPEERDKPYLYIPDEQGNPQSPGWQVINLQADFQYSERIRVSTAVENLMNRRYRPYSSGIAAPGRNLTLSVCFSL